MGGTENVLGKVPYVPFVQEVNLSALRSGCSSASDQGK